MKDTHPMDGEGVKRLLQDSGNRMIYIRDCSICGYPLHYIIHPIHLDNVWLDTSCNCTSEPGGRFASLDNIADWYNMQGDAEAQTDIIFRIRGAVKAP